MQGACVFGNLFPDVKNTGALLDRGDRKEPSTINADRVQHALSLLAEVAPCKREKAPLSGLFKQLLRYGLRIPVNVDDLLPGSQLLIQFSVRNHANHLDLTSVSRVRTIF